MFQSNTTIFYYIVLNYLRQILGCQTIITPFLQRKLKQVTSRAHYIQCRIGSHKSYNTVTILFQRCNY